MPQRPRVHVPSITGTVPYNVERLLNDLAAAINGMPEAKASGDEARITALASDIEALYNRLQILQMSTTAPTAVGGGVAISAGTELATSGTVRFSNANGLSFGMAGSVITGSYTVPAAGTPAFSASGGSSTFNTLSFLNSNGLTFSNVGGAVIASYTVPSTAGFLTTAMASNRGSDFVQATAAFAGTNASGTINSTGISVSVNAPGAPVVAAAGSNGSFLFSTLEFVTGNGATFYTDATGIRLSYTVPAASDFVQATAVFAGTNASGTIASGGISVSVNAVTPQTNQTVGWYASSNTTLTSSGTADARSLTVRAIGSLTAGFSAGELLLSAPLALTTAMASDRGSDFVQATAGFFGTSASGTIASDGISVSIGPYLTTAMASNRGSDFVQATAAFAGTSASGTIASGGISISIGPYLTTAMASNRGSDFVQATAAFAGTSASGTIASGGISVSIGPYITTAMASNRGSDFVQATAAFAGTSASGTIASNGISVSIGPYITTAMASNRGSDFVQATAAFAGTNASGTINSTGISVSVGNYITTARASTDAIGLNTAQTNVTWTVNSSGLSINAAGYAGTATAATGASLTVNSDGVSINVGAAPVSEFMPYAHIPPVTNSTLGQSTLYFVPFDVDAAVYGSRINFFLSLTATWSGANTRSASLGFGYALYTRQAGTAMATLSRLTSYSLAYLSIAGNSSTVMALTMYNGLSDITSHSTLQSNLSNASVPTFISNSILGHRVLALPLNQTLTPGRYWLGVSHRSGSSNGSAIFSASVMQQQISNQIAFRNFATSSAASNASFYAAWPGFGTYSAVSAGWPDSIPLSSDSIRNAPVGTLPYFNISGYSTSLGVL